MGMNISNKNIFYRVGLLNILSGDAKNPSTLCQVILNALVGTIILLMLCFVASSVIVTGWVWFQIPDLDAATLINGGYIYIAAQLLSGVIAFAIVVSVTVIGLSLAIIGYLILCVCGLVEMVIGERKPPELYTVTKDAIKDKFCPIVNIIDND